MHHWLWFDGREIGNATRTKEYLNRFHPTVETPELCSSCGSCDLPPGGTAFSGLTVDDGVVTWNGSAFDVSESGGVITGWNAFEGSFISPSQDPAPWYTTIEADSNRFYGFLPLRVDGTVDSTREAFVSQKLGDGGTVIGERLGTKEVRVMGALIGSSVSAVDVGQTWLDHLLDAGRGDSCGHGVALRWLNRCPATVDDLELLSRELRDCKVVSGPAVINDSSTCNIHVRQIEFTVVSAQPWVYHQTVPQLAYVGGVQEPRRDGVLVQTTPWMLPTCNPPAELSPINDPTNPLPPPPPFVTGGGSPPVWEWDNHKVVTLPAGMAAKWMKAAPTITITAGSAGARGVRVRIVDAVSSSATAQTVDPCDSAGEFLISYIPPNHSVVVDSAMSRVSAFNATGVEFVASHLVMSSIPGGLFEYPIIEGDRRHFVYVDSNEPVGIAIDVTVRT